MTMVRRNGRFCAISFFNNKSRKTQKETCSEGEYRFAVLPTPSHPPPVPSTFAALLSAFHILPSSGWNWTCSRWPQIGLNPATALVILCGFGCVTAAWLGYGTLITLPPGGQSEAQWVTSREWEKKNLPSYTGIIPKLL